LKEVPMQKAWKMHHLTQDNFTRLEPHTPHARAPVHIANGFALLVS
jgi:hypothetical protein